MSTTQDQVTAKTSTRDLGDIRQRLTAWMARTLGPNSQPRLSELRNPGSSGMSSETLLFDMTWNDNGGERSGAFVGRMPPTSDAFPIFPKYDFDLQVNVLRLVKERSAVKVPKVVWHEPSPEPLGMPFFIMERAEGEALPDIPPYVFGGWLLEASPENQAKLQQQSIAAVAGVHGVKASKAEVEFLKPKTPGDTAMRRKFSEAKAFYDWARGEDLRVPLVEELMAWLENNWPESESDPVVCWGDARPGNMLWQNFEATAVLDWEMATLGPRELDIAWMIFHHKYMQQIAVFYGFPAPPMPDFQRRDDVVSAYEKLTGYKVRDINWYLCFDLMWMSIVDIRISRRAIHFGEKAAESDPNNHLYCRELIRKLLHNQQDVWA